MSILEQVKADTTAALKAGDRARAQALRLITAELQKAVKDADGVDEITVLQRERKRRAEAAEAYRNGERTDLAEAEESEAAIIEAYLPAQIEDAELEALAANAVAEAGATDIKDMGRVMAALMENVGGRAEGKRVSAAVKALLSP